MKKVLIPVAALGALLLAGCSWNGTNDDDMNLSGHTTTVVTGTSDNTTDNDSTPMDDADFVSWAMTSNEAELDLVRLGKEMGTDGEIKSLAASMETDHGKSGQELADYASKKSINVDDDDADDANDMIRDHIDELKNEAKGAEWDKKWVNLMIDMHEDAIAQYKDGGDEADDQELKSWISKTIPTLQSHLDKLRAIDDRIDK